MDNVLKTNLTGKINNLPHFKNEALLPVFEAIVNSIQAIEDAGISDGRIIVRIKRSGQESISQAKITKDIIGFEIEDNGIGFNDDNYLSFCTAESIYKMNRGGKGVGRFFWLKAFEKIDIESYYFKNKTLQRRDIEFNLNIGIIKKDKEETSQLVRKTIVRMIGFKKMYQVQPTAYKTTEKIAQRILEHSLAYFIYGKPPLIIIEDSDSETPTLSLQSLYEQNVAKNISTEETIISGNKFRISHLKLYHTHNKIHNIVFCADNRDVELYNISKMLGTSNLFDEEQSKFVYAAYVSGDLLNQNVNPDRLTGQSH